MRANGKQGAINFLASMCIESVGMYVALKYFYQGP